jgi:hypothetical protein
MKVWLIVLTKTSKSVKCTMIIDVRSLHVSSVVARRRIAEVGAETCKGALLESSTRCGITVVPNYWYYRIINPLPMLWRYWLPSPDHEWC